MNDMAYRDFFFFTMVSVLHIAVPTAFPIVMLYFYMFATFAHAVLFGIGQFKFLFITYLVKNVLLFLIIMSLLVDNWCDFFDYRNNDGYDIVQTSNTTTT